MYQSRAEGDATRDSKVCSSGMHGWMAEVSWQEHSTLSHDIEQTMLREYHVASQLLRHLLIVGFTSMFWCFVLEAPKRHSVMRLEPAETGNMLRRVCAHTAPSPARISCMLRYMRQIYLAHAEEGMLHHVVYWSSSRPLSI